MKWFLLFLTVFFLIWHCWTTWPDHFFHLITCDVGQGDAILIQQDFFQILIDSGPDESVLGCLFEHMPPLDNTIEMTVLTHFDDDHIGGMSTVMNFYHLDTVLLALTDSKDSEAFLEVKERLLSAQQQGTVLKQPILGQQMSFISRQDESQRKNIALQAKYNSTDIPLLVTVLTPISLEAQTPLSDYCAWPQPETPLSAVTWEHLTTAGSENDRSIVLFVQYGNTKFLLTGDLESTGEQALLANNLIAQVDVLKVGHHGSKTSTSLEFLTRLQPEMSVISCGQGNSYGHPDQEVIARLNQSHIAIQRTDRDATLDLVSDGKYLWFKEQTLSSFYRNL